MAFGHEIRYVSWSYEVVCGLNLLETVVHRFVVPLTANLQRDSDTRRFLKGVDRHARDQLLRASQSISLNIAEGNGKGTNAGWRRFFEIARKKGKAR